MSVIINPIITNAGLNVFTPMATGIEFTFTHVAVGTGTSAVNANATALENEIDRFTIAGGGVIAGGKAVSINALVTNHSNANPQDYNISEIGFYGLDGNNNTVLFAIHRQSTTIVRKVSGADIALPFVLGLSALPVENMTVTIDTNTSGALALLGQHVANAHPHTQYKRTLDNTERLKIASAVDADDAIRKDELDALRVRLIANGIDADIGTTNHLPNINVDSYLIPEGYFDDSTLGDKPFAYGLCKTRKENVGVIYQFAQSYTNGDIATRLWRGTLGYWTSWKYYASLNGDADQVFNVANATNPSHAVSKEQLDAKANLGGSETQRFKIADAVDNDEAVSKSQLDSAVSGIPPADLSGKADLAGSSTQTFSVAAATAAEHAVRKDQFDAKTDIATDTIAGIVEKATQAEMNAGTANVWPDAATLLSGFSQSSSSIRLPEWLGGWLIQWGYTQVGDVGVSNDLSTTVFTTTYVSQPHVMVSGWTDAGSSSFSVNVRSVTTGSFVAILAEWNEVIQSNNTGYNWLAIGK